MLVEFTFWMSTHSRWERPDSNFQQMVDLFEIEHHRVSPNPDLNFTTMVIDKFTTQGETNTRAFAGGLGCEEIVEYFAPKVVRNAGAVVREGDDDRVILTRRLNKYRG